MTGTTHIGRKIGRIRELRGMKQETLAEKLGISQQSVSKLEQHEDIEELMLERIAKALDVTPETIKNFNEEAAIYNTQNNYDRSNEKATNVGNYYCTLSMVDKWVEVVEENKKLYEALLKEKDEKISLLQKFAGKQKSVVKKKKK